jgi:hypothetical protein
MHHFNSDTNIASASQVRASAMLLLLIAGNYKFRCWNFLQKHNIRTKFRENRSIGSTIYRDARTGSMVITYSYVFCFRRGTKIKVQ